MCRSGPSSNDSEYQDRVGVTRFPDTWYEREIIGIIYSKFEFEVLMNLRFLDCIDFEKNDSRNYDNLPKSTRVQQKRELDEKNFMHDIYTKMVDLY
ncbi:hypothetical protein AVEN_190756-1 [Araneus ventricosus]|uniref:Uncharacterized protein n=1 Tax=Araneus ventricosus TaxID=182803 RepID=A0A4Y2HS83_ARAVE|nr:hypothetical protein AVEN_190756-1 [Araneus ventricosus]